jgi:hypothetical protein
MKTDFPTLLSWPSAEPTKEQKISKAIANGKKFKFFIVLLFFRLILQNCHITWQVREIIFKYMKNRASSKFKIHVLKHQKF